MKPRQQRMLAVGLAVAGVAIATVLTLPRVPGKHDVFRGYLRGGGRQGSYPDDRNFRVGGLVVAGSVARNPGDLEVKFTLTDTKNTLDVFYNGVLPDLFREGQGIVAHGRMNDNGGFVADTVLAKHDENYMPPEVAESLAKHAAEKAGETVVEGR